MKAKKRKPGQRRIGWVQSHQWVLPALLVAATALAYFPAWNGKPVWDDDAHLTRPDLRSLPGLISIWTHPGLTRQYYPLTHTVFWIEQPLWGNTWFPYHLVNIGLHALSAILLWKILLRLEISGAWLAAAFFALHPVQVESVAWISELKNALSGVFFFSSVLVYLRFDETRLGKLYGLALGLFLLGLLSKSVIAMMPAGLLIVFWWKRGRLGWKRDLVPLIPFFAVGIASGLLTAWVERNFIGAQGAIFHLSLIERGLIAGRAFWFYPFKLLWPAKIIFIYPRWQISVSAWWQYLFPVAAAFLLLGTWMLRRRTRAPLAALLFFLVMLFPASGFLNVYPFRFSFVANHFQYLASISFFVLAAAALSLIGRHFKLVSYGLSLALILLLATLTWQQAQAYADPIALYEATLQDNPDCWMAHNNLGIELLQKGQTNEAIEHYRETLAIQPENAEAHTNLGNAFTMLGRFGEAIPEYEKTLELAPNSVPPRNNLAWLLAMCPDVSLRDGAKAVQVAQKAVQLSAGKDPVIFRTLAAAYAENGQFPEAVSAAGKGLELARAEGQKEWTHMMLEESKVYQTHQKLHY